MKVESLTLKNFKRFDALTIEFKNAVLGEIADRFLILGDNGSGKTTVLQAIALGFSMASGRITTIADVDWIGWMPERYSRREASQIEMVVHFTDDEIEATLQAAWLSQKVKGAGSPGIPAEPVRSNMVRVGLDGERLWTDDRDDPHPQLTLFRRRSYAASIIGEDPSSRGLFERLPGVFWFDQFRNLATAPGSREVESNGGFEAEPAEAVTYAAGVSRLRHYLNRWQFQRLQAGPNRGQVDYLLELEDHYKRIFLGRSFADPEPMFRGGVPSPVDSYFMLSDGHGTYDLEEMSSGEQSVFPMLYEFVRQRIRNSIVLIDEIDLNLDPAVPQGLLANLSHIGPQFRFIFTTHSRVISGVVSPHEICRLPGGRPCL